MIFYLYQLQTSTEVYKQIEGFGLVNEVQYSTENNVLDIS